MQTGSAEAALGAVGAVSEVAQRIPGHEALRIPQARCAQGALVHYFLKHWKQTCRCLAAFLRFYFISDDELLAILGTSDPTSVQEHMLKLFDNSAGMHVVLYAWLLFVAK